MGHKKSTWEELSENLGGVYTRATFLKPEKVDFEYQNIKIVLDSYMVMVGNAPITYTRVRSIFKNPRQLKLKLYKEGFLSQIGKMLGMQDIVVNDVELDQRYIIKGNDEVIIGKLLTDYRLKQLLISDKPVELEINNKDKCLIEEDESLVSFQATGLIKDLDQLNHIMEIFWRLYDVMVEMELTNDFQIGSVLK